MHFVFLVGSYYPYYSAVGKCVGNVADVLAKKHEVTVICLKNNSNQLDEEEYNNHRILRIATKDKMKRERMANNIKRTSGTKKKFYISILNIIKLQQASKLVFSRTSIKKELVDSYLSKLLDINEKIDVLIPASMPFESVVAAHNYKKKYNTSVVLIPYLFDQFVENESLHRMKVNKWIKRKKHMKIEKNIISNSKSVLIMKQLREYFSTNYSDYVHLFHEVEHPLIVRVDQPSFDSDNNKSIDLTYAGSFYKNIRDPEYMLKVFDLSLSRINGVLNLYTFGNCGKIIKDFAMKNNLIKDNGRLPSNLVADVLSKADYLVAVGNTVSNQVPSKIFEYLSIGKPIIYFYSIEGDTNVEVVKKYPNGLCIKQNDNRMEDNILKLTHFCAERKNNIVSFEEVSKIFPDAMPEHTAQLIERIVFED